MAVEVVPLRNVTNAQILNAIRNSGSPLYQQRITPATDGKISDTLESLTQYRTHWNEFVDALVNRIGLVIARNRIWSNPLAEFKQGMLTSGATIEEVQVGLLQAHEYNPDRDYMEKDIFGTEVPEVQSNFHTINRQNFYKITVNEAMLKRAFLADDGLRSFVNQMLDAPLTSDEWDEFLLMSSLFRQYEANGGFYAIRVPDVSDMESNEADAKYALRKARALADNMTFLNTKYNAAKMPTFASRDDLILFTTPEFNAAVDVEALAGAFNMERAKMYGRIVTIPREHFGIEGCEAILTTKDFFVVADTMIETAQVQNPVGLNYNHFLHHHEIVSASRFVPAVMLSTTRSDEVSVIPDSVESVSIDAVYDDEGNSVTEVQRGLIYQVPAAVALASGAEGGIRYSVSGGTSSRTYISQTGVLHVGGDETASTLTVTAESAYIDPRNPADNPTSDTVDVTVTGPFVPLWPATGKGIQAITVAGETVPFATGTAAYTLDVDGSHEPVEPDDVLVTATGGSVDVDVDATGETVTVTYDPGRDSAPTVYTITVTYV